ncbi:hypothetical protein ILYODFUR_032815 [Ilyodon furcidens]|uniref:Uncharacterized protein n=1 Tax=Ilyodon furcidens TaxID=33524 RepID=A0ABV0VJ23_9TELE
MFEGIFRALSTQTDMLREQNRKLDAILEQNRRLAAFPGLKGAPIWPSQASYQNISPGCSVNTTLCPSNPPHL